MVYHEKHKIPMVYHQKYRKCGHLAAQGPTATPQGGALCNLLPPNLL